VHELSVCQGLLRQVDKVAAEHEARSVSRILLRVGALSGVEPDLLTHAFDIARMGTLAENAALEIERGAVTVRCRQCGTRGEVPSNRLVCPHCGDWRVDVTGGEELLLLSLDLET
jgi:hydrogenase nickel incorporation protein HypA/HybF